MSPLWTSERSEWIILTTMFVVATSVSIEAYSSNRAIDTTTQDDIDDFVPYQGERSNTFDWNLLKSLGKNHRGNLLISPISLKLSLILLFEGAQDNTARELASVMNLPARAATREKFSTLLKSLEQSKPEYELNVGSSIYMDINILARQRYASIIKTFYNTDIVATNFSDTSASADKINNFVKNITKGHIDKLVTNDTDLKDNLMYIASALFFRGLWYRQPFSVNNTKIEPFCMADGKTILNVPYMKTNKKFYFAYVDSINSKILRLPYAGRKYAMYLILPQLPGEIDRVLQKITPSSVNSFAWNMEEVNVDVSIPKFKFDFTSHLEKTLRELGIHEIFEDTATLTGILRSKSTSKDLIVTDIVQKAGIEVNERGAVVYTATEIEIGNKINDETFHANHSFLFYIEDEITATILYMGVVNNPREETGMAEATPPQEPANSLAQMPPNFDEHGSENPVSDVFSFDVGINDRQNFFNIELLQKLAEVQGGNIVVGTSSVKTALMILAEAAAGQTYQELESTLRLSTDSEKQRTLASLSTAPIKDAANKIKLQNAIKLWISKDTRLLKMYNDILRLVYKGDIESVNFHDTKQTIKIINDWVKKQTYGHINSIIDEGSIASDTSLILTTAVYFKGAWLQAFDKSATRVTCFQVPKVGCKNVHLMENVALYNIGYIPNIDSQVVQIPYAGNKASMLIILPTRTGERVLNDVLRNLAFTPIPSILRSLFEAEVALQIPRFSISNKMNLRAPLEQLGIRELFQNNANLTNAFPYNTAKVGAVIHNAQIDVNEEGTVASAVTGVSVIPLMGTTSINFRADRPFIFLLLDNQTNNILFAGRFVQPDREIVSDQSKP